MAKITDKMVADLKTEAKIYIKRYLDTGSDYRLGYVTGMSRTFAIMGLSDLWDEIEKELGVYNKL